MQPMGFLVQVSYRTPAGGIVLLSGDAACDRDPCEKHGRCHCMCPCMMEVGDDCDDCVEQFGDD